MSAQSYYADSPSLCSAQSTEVCFLSLDIRTMGTRMFDGFNSDLDQRKKLTSRKNSSITICLVSSPSRRVVVWSLLPRRNSSRRFFLQQLRVKEIIYSTAFSHSVTPFSTSTFRLRDPLPPEKIIALGLYRLGHENSFVTIGPSFNGVSCYLRKNLEIERELLAELPVCIVFHHYECFADKHWQLPLWFQLFGSTFWKSARLWCFTDSQSFCQSENPGPY